VKKPFYARVVAFTRATTRRMGSGPKPTFVINARISDGPDAHMDRPILVHITSTLRARQLAESLTNWADAADKDS
jgi:hypothetical protein